MRASRAEDKGLNVFLDSGVVISAVLSFSGCSLHLIRELIYTKSIGLKYILQSC